MRDWNKETTELVRECFARAAAREETSPRLLDRAARLLSDLEAEVARLQSAADAEAEREFAPLGEW